MQNYLKSIQFFQDNIVTWISFFILSFLLEVLTIGLLSFSILRETKRAWLSKDRPDIAVVWKEVPWDIDIAAWAWHLGIKSVIRIAGAVFLWPVYSTASGLWEWVPILGFFAYIVFFLLIIILCTLESLCMHWLQLLHIDGYSNLKDAWKVNRAYVQKMSRDVSEFCFVESCIHIPFLFSCAMPAVISRPIILMARLMAYEEEREHIYALGKQEGIERL